MADNVVHTPASTTASNGPIKAPLTPLDRGEAPSDWASSTLDALGPVTSKPYPDDERPAGQTGLTTTQEASAYPSSTPATPGYPSSTATTPGPQFPGAFPQGYPKSSALSPENVKVAAASALETAKGYVATAGETVGGYLPQSMAAYLPQQNNKVDPDPNTKASPGSDYTSGNDSPYFPNTPAGKTPYSPAESETMRDGGEDGAMLSPPSQRQDSDLGASANASTRSLAGSRVDTWSRTTPATSFMVSDLDKTKIGTTSGQDDISKATNSTTESNMNMHGSTSVATAAQAANQQAQNHLDDLETPDLEHHTDETAHIPSDVDANGDTKWHAPDVTSPTHYESPNTAAREYPIAAVDVKGLPHQDSAYSNIATPGHGQMSPSASTGNSKTKEKDFAEVDAASGTGSAISDGHRNTLTAASGTETTTASAIDSATIGIGPTLSNSTKSKDTAEDGTTKDLPTVPNSNTMADDKNASPPTVPPKKTKSGFMDKLRGEMKIISGKLEHKQENVEEGRRMKGKTTKN